MSYWQNNGCLAILLFFCWMGIVVGLPGWIYDSYDVAICGVIGMSIGMAALALMDQKEGRSFKKEIPFTYTHLWIFLAYAVSGIFMVGFGNLSYEDMRAIGKGSVFYILLPIIAFIADCLIFGRNKTNRSS